MTNPTLITTPFAENGDKNIIPESVGANPQNATMQAGFPPITQQKISEGGIPPERNDFNGILNLYGQHIVHQNKGLSYEFDQAFADQIGGYPLGAELVLSDGLTKVVSTIPNNTSNPNSSMSGWSLLSSSAIQSGINGFDSQLSFNSYLNNQVSFYVTPENFGVTGTSDDYEVLQQFFLSPLPKRIPAKSYRTSKTLYTYENNSIIGDSSSTSIITKTTTDLPTNLPTISGVNCNVDAVLVVLRKEGSTSIYAKKVQIQGLKLIHINSSSTTGYGLFAPWLAESLMIDLQAWYGEVGIYTRNVWMCTWIRCQSHSIGGWVLGGYEGEDTGGGTSNTLISCWSTGTGSGYWAWNVHLTDSNFISCNADYVGSDGSPANGIWFIYDGSSVTISQTTYEVVHAYRHIYIRNSVAKISGIKTQNIYNKYGSEYYLFDFLNSRVEYDLAVFNLTYNIDNATYGEVVPNFLQCTSGSVVNISNVFPYPRITGVNNGTKFQIRVTSSSKMVYDSDGGRVEVSQGTNLAMPSMTVFTNTTDRAITTSSTITSTNVANDASFGLTGTNAAKWNTSKLRLGNMRIWYSDTYSSFLYKSSPPTSDTDGIPLFVTTGAKSGTTANRPTSASEYMYIGRFYLDTTLNKPIWWNGSAWVDSLGTVV